MKKALLAAVLIWLVSCGVVTVLLPNDKPLKADTSAVNDALLSGVSPYDILNAEYAKINAETRGVRLRLRVFLYIYAGAVSAAGLCLYVYCEKAVLKPFRDMKGFARSVAAGNLDIPLLMDKNENFGAFTEAFDIMREELKKARENERAADRSRKELVASLSHDIKTPVASIKAAAELMLVTAADGKEKAMLEQIYAKAEQINALVTDMFHSALEDLQKLSVTPAEVPASVIPELIRAADYKNKETPFTVPDCIISADTARLQQVFDNIIGNSYKYADTDIEINSRFGADCLITEISDTGAGIPERELPLIMNKFTRGTNAGDKNGYGLGLYIAKYLITAMSGEITCENGGNGGFTVRIMLKLA